MPPCLPSCPPRRRSRVRPCARIRPRPPPRARPRRAAVKPFMPRNRPNRRGAAWISGWRMRAAAPWGRRPPFRFHCCRRCGKGRCRRAPPRTDWPKLRRAGLALGAWTGRFERAGRGLLCGAGPLAGRAVCRASWFPVPWRAARMIPRAGRMKARALDATAFGGQHATAPEIAHSRGNPGACQERTRQGALAPVRTARRMATGHRSGPRAASRPSGCQKPMQHGAPAPVRNARRVPLGAGQDGTRHGALAVFRTARRKPPWWWLGTMRRGALAPIGHARRMAPWRP